MRIINCHIENFGKLSDYNREFTEGCNSIMASNGQGKSTLAAFIRVMFYGFTGEGKRRAVENERKRYEPWQGGVYGGRLTFDDGNGRYTIIRTFGSKSGEDTFELRDESTNLVSDAYSENVGEQLSLRRGAKERLYRTEHPFSQRFALTAPPEGEPKRFLFIYETASWPGTSARRRC